ncbi:uncharacterized protein LOC141851109 [Brevipalpus obovatus]|uniref:uncharacterized protein LOC141851109 n=1 Tax=Brevipalpus obovatus TaxID=246614 RepID=UPI003D9E9EAF
MLPVRPWRIILIACLASLLNELVEGVAPQCNATSKDPGCLYKVDNCIFLWAQKAKIETIENPESKSPKIVSEEIILNEKNSEISGKCFQQVNTTMVASMDLTFTGLNNFSSSVKLNTVLRKSSIIGGYWIVEKANLSLTESEEVSLNSKVMTASDGFSFSCSSLQLEAKEKMEKSKETKLYIFSLYRMQLQPFRSNATVFVDSFDCSTWMTIPTFMGLMAMILFTMIVATGVTFLASIKTPDRFENAKSKPLTIATSE